jgi:PmbA protein
MNKQDRLDLAHWVVGQTKARGADEVAVVLSNSRQVEVEYRDRKLDKLMESTRNSLFLHVYSQKRYSGHNTNDLRRESLEKFIEEALHSTKYLTQDEFRTLPDPKYYPSGAPADLKILDAAYDGLDSPGRVKIAAAIEAAAMAESDAIISTTAGYSDSHDESIRVHSNGLVGEMERTTFSAGAEVTVKDKDSGRPEDWEYATTSYFRDLPDPATLGKGAARRALRKLNQKKIQSGRYTMMVENRAASRLVGLLTGPMSANALQQKRSWLDGMLGKKIASERLTLIDDPLLERGLGSRHFDGEGLAPLKRTMIEAGILRQYYVDNYYGKKLGMEPTTGGSSNLVLAPGPRTAEDMLKGVQRGILVNGFIGGNSNTTTGDFSFGIVGALIENGALGTPLHEMNISGNAKEFWNQLADVGNDPYPYSSWRIPTLLFEGVSFSGL